MKNQTGKPDWIFGLLLIPLLSAILALVYSHFIFKAGVAISGIFILAALNFSYLLIRKDLWAIFGAFLFSIAGDWFLSNRHGEDRIFIAGIAMFFMAHAFYLTFALMNGRLNRIGTALILALYLGFFFLILFPGIGNFTLMAAALLYLLISCFSLGAAIGITDASWFKWLYVFGIFMVLFSDTIISLREFVGYPGLNFIILPTYYLSQLGIVAALIYRIRNQPVR